jgi:2'-5' RNA ligase
MSNNLTERLFFALWPSIEVRQAIEKLTQPITQSIEGRKILVENWHITLAFVGEVESTTKQCMQQVAATIQNNRFTLTLDKLDYRAKNQILWLGATETPDALHNLVMQLNTALQNCGYQPDTRPFKTHLTLMRKAKQIKTLPLITPVTWTIKDFCLVRSMLDSKGAHYEIINCWTLN